MPGFTGNGFISCDDINECATANGGCSMFAECANSPGSYNCTCKFGYVGDGVDCNATSVCSSSPCQNGGTCVPLNDTYNCTCPFGYTPLNNCGKRCGGFEILFLSSLTPLDTVVPLTSLWTVGMWVYRVSTGGSDVQVWELHAETLLGDGFDVIVQGLASLDLLGVNVITPDNSYLTTFPWGVNQWQYVTIQYHNNDVFDVYADAVFVGSLTTDISTFTPPILTNFYRVLGMATTNRHIVRNVEYYALDTVNVTTIYLNLRPSNYDLLRQSSLWLNDIYPDHPTPAADYSTLFVNQGDVTPTNTVFDYPCPANMPSWL